MKQIGTIFYFFIVLLLLGYIQNSTEIQEEKQWKAVFLAANIKEEKETEQKEIKNNGGSVIEAGDLVYYIDSSQGAVCSMNLDGTDQKKLFDSGFTNTLYKIDNFIFTSYYQSGKSMIYRYCLDTNELIEFTEGGWNMRIIKQRKFIVQNYVFPMNFFMCSFLKWMVIIKTV